MLDAIIVGGGPAGLAAAMTLGRALRSALVIDSGEPRNAPAQEMHNFISRDGTPPAELRRLTRAELKHYATVGIRDTTVASAAPLDDGGFEIGLADGTTERARRLILASGLVDELPPVAGLAELWGHGVFHCPYCHGFEVRDRMLAVLGADQPAVHLALHLARFSDDGVLCTNGVGELDAETRVLLATNGIDVREEPIARLEGSIDGLERIIFQDGQTLDRDAMFCSSRLRQRSDLPAQLGCTMLENGCVEVNDLAQTSVSGVYAVGDMAHRATQHGPAAAVIAAAATGCLAGIAVDKDLLATDLGIHNPMAGARA